MQLTGFLTTEDLNTIIVEKGNVELEYTTPTAGVNKEIKFVHTERDIINNDMPEFNSTDRTFFKLSGAESENYELDQDSLPRMQGTILKRPINVSFYPVSKVYDGTTTLDKNELMYAFTPTSSSASGLVYGTSKYRTIYNLDSSYEITNGGKGYKVGDILSLNFTEMPVDGMPNENSLDAGFPSYAQFEVKITAVDGDGAVTRLQVLGQDSFISPVAYSYTESNEEFRYILKFNHGSDVYYDFIGPYRTDYSWQLIEKYSILKSKSVIQGRGLNFTLTVNVQPYTLDCTDTAISHFTPSDIDKVTVNCNNVTYSTKNVTNKLMPLIFTRPKLQGGHSGDVSDCYELQNISGWGIITPRVLTVSCNFASKVYDGTTNITPINIQYDNVVSGDSVYMNIADNAFYSTSKNVGTYVICDPNKFGIQLSGVDRTNYIAQFTSNLPSVTITKRHVNVDVKFIRLILSTGKFEIAYSINNIISLDDVRADITQGKIELPNGTTLSTLFLSEEDYDVTKLQYTRQTGRNDRIRLQITTDNDTITEVTNGEKVKITGINIIGTDTNNYELQNSYCENVPIYFIYAH